MSISLSRLIDTFEFKNKKHEKRFLDFYKNFDLTTSSKTHSYPNETFYSIANSFFDKLGGAYSFGIKSTIKNKNSFQTVLDKYTNYEVENDLWLINLDLLMTNLMFYKDNSGYSSSNFDNQCSVILEIISEVYVGVKRLSKTEIIDLYEKISKFYSDDSFDQVKKYNIFVNPHKDVIVCNFILRRNHLKKISRRNLERVQLRFLKKNPADKIINEIPYSAESKDSLLYALNLERITWYRQDGPHNYLDGNNHHYLKLISILMNITDGIVNFKKEEIIDIYIQISPMLSPSYLDKIKAFNIFLDPTKDPLLCHSLFDKNFKEMEVVKKLGYKTLDKEVYEP